jgi:hypothetical protein
MSAPSERQRSDQKFFADLQTAQQEFLCNQSKLYHSTLKELSDAQLTLAKIVTLLAAVLGIVVSVSAVIISWKLGS